MQPLISTGDRKVTKPAHMLRRSDVRLLWAVAVVLSLPCLSGAGESAARESVSVEPAAGEPAAVTGVDYLRDIRPIFERACYSCHGPDRQRSSLRLDRRSAAMKGGDLGIAIVAGKSSESALVRYISGSEDELRMPPEGDSLSADEVSLIRNWIDAGAVWPDEYAQEDDEKKELWSLAPLHRPVVPQPAHSEDSVKNPVDAFVISALQEKSLSPTPEADRRTLIRRVTMDLHGLQPTPEEVDQFLEDTRPDAWEQLIDRLLESPRYGERWARHWLDVVHYADSHGQDQDRPRPNAWPYRDFLIRALNDDLPYSRFVEQQIAGDVLYPDDPQAIAATGFLAAGPWDESSLQSIREDSIDRLIGQNLDRDDIVTSTTSTFLGLTAGCARCHDHKFDPITQQDYYGLQAVFSGIDKADRPYDADPQLAELRRTLARQLEEVRNWANQAPDQILTSRLEESITSFEQTRAESESLWTIPEPLKWSATQGSILKPLLDRSILTVGMRPDKDTYSVTAAATLPMLTAVRLELLPDETLPMLGPGRQENGNLHLSEVRIKVHARDDASSAPHLLIHEATADFSQADWEVEKSIDGKPSTAWGIHPEVGKPHTAVFELKTPVPLSKDSVITVELDQLHGTGHLIGRFRIAVTDQSSSGPRITAVPQAVDNVLKIPREQRTAAQRVTIAAWLEERRLKQEQAALPAPLRVYSGTPVFQAEGTFRPAGGPRPVFVLTRGDINKPQAPAVPGALHVLDPLVGRLSLTQPEQEGQRRAAFARWVTSPENPLTWRVIVNRVWHYHFGRGIVDTPNDLGTMGGKPSHPELLDWLAVEFRDGGGSLKQLHRLILQSRTWRQATTHSDHASAIDGENRLLWRMNRRRLDAESIRDSLLQISGQLDLTLYGPPVMQFRAGPGIHVTPMADYLNFDVDSAESRRRSVYRFIFRTLPDPWLDSLDCPDASQSAPVRGDSVGAIQALALWNNKFTLRQSEHLAERAVVYSREHGNLPSAPSSGQTTDGTSAEAQVEPADLTRQIRFISSHILCRQPQEAELMEWAAYAQQFGVANFCRVLLNSSEFLFVD